MGGGGGDLAQYRTSRGLLQQLTPQVNWPSLTPPIPSSQPYKNDCLEEMQASLYKILSSRCLMDQGLKSI